MHLDYIYADPRPGDKVEADFFPDGDLVVSLVDSRGQRVSLRLTPPMVEFLATAIESRKAVSTDA